jgi:CRISPR-associated protein Cas2
MYVIGVYDINTTDPKGSRRLRKILLLFRRYLHHVQKSVFEGELVESKYKELKQKIEKIIAKNLDTVILFKMNNPNWIEKDFLGCKEDVTDNII